jgi:GTP pyrophosphokinase
MEHKHVYEIYKMIEEGKLLTDIDNFYSMVISLKTNDYSEAYRVYGIIANVFGPVSSLDDYIARPKINLYRALHSTHFGPGRKLVEVIIRTEEMDMIVEKGIAAHYKPGHSMKPLALDEEHVYEWVDWMQEIIAEGDKDAIQQIWGSIRKNLYEDEIILHSKDGTTYLLPRGSCPIDLAFAISEEIAFHCISAKVNGEIKSLDIELNNFDTVEIITSPNSLPSHEWQNYVITNKAVVKLHKYFKNYSADASNFNHEVTHQEIKLKIVGEDRLGLISEIKTEIGIRNISRIFLYTSNSSIEAVFHVHTNKIDSLNVLFTKLLGIKGLRGLERLDSLEF